MARTNLARLLRQVTPFVSLSIKLRTIVHSTMILFVGQNRPFVCQNRPFVCQNSLFVRAKKNEGAIQFEIVVFIIVCYHIFGAQLGGGIRATKKNGFQIRRRLTRAGAAIIF